MLTFESSLSAQSRAHLSAHLCAHFKLNQELLQSEAHSRSPTIPYGIVLIVLGSPTLPIVVKRPHAPQR